MLRTIANPEKTSQNLGHNDTRVFHLHEIFYSKINSVKKYIFLIEKEEKQAIPLKFKIFWQENLTFIFYKEDYQKTIKYSKNYEIFFKISIFYFNKANKQQSGNNEL